MTFRMKLGGAVAAVLAFAGLAVVGASQDVTSAAATTSCAMPTGSSISNKQLLTYNACRFDELAAQVDALGAPSTSSTPSPSPSPSASPSSTPTASATPSPTPTPTPTVSPTPTPTASPSATPAASSWPDATNTGVPAGTTLTTYTGPCTITSSVTITAVDATACGAITVKAPNVVITKSKLPRIDATFAGTYSISLTDDTVSAGQWFDGAIWGSNITATRVNATGGQHTFHCDDHCTVTDSWLHGQWNPDGQSFHNNAFISNGGTDMVIRHNTLHCTSGYNSTDGGCTADLSLFGDFGPISHVTIDGNLFKANNVSNSYCLYSGWNPGKPYGDNPTYVQVTNNVFERGPNGICGVYGPDTSFKASGTGNTWVNNTWDNGGAVAPSA